MTDRVPVPDGPPDVKALRELLAGATRLPWRIVRFGASDFAFHPPHPPVDGDAEIGKAYQYCDAELAVAAVNALPGLLGRLEELQGALKDIAAEWIGTCNEWERTGIDCGTCDRCLEVARIAALLEVSP